MPAWAAIIAAWVRLRACILAITFRTCFLVVSRVIPRVAAIILFDTALPVYDNSGVGPHIYYLTQGGFNGEL